MAWLGVRFRTEEDDEARDADQAKHASGKGGKGSRIGSENQFPRRTDQVTLPTLATPLPEPSRNGSGAVPVAALMQAIGHG